ncbi:hypothetical protein [Fusibacter sp. 3D3]|uniref:hypothetical protein n=1 Tax=Fusibacter sp. 3D3 TaxID=1048380 RepID=UPI000852CA0C|nr:hypothetical protein [Fusibacter sp. 3D3]GAU75826.1 hypothetical protein F3D3_0422 [Fusibacter sp. 3D3]
MSIDYNKFTELMSYFHFVFNIYYVLIIILVFNASKAIFFFYKSPYKPKIGNIYDLIISTLVGFALNTTRSIPIEDVRNHHYDFNWAYLSGDTERYTKFLNDILSVEYIPSAIKLDDDGEIVNWDSQKGSIGNTYACCERKMLSFIKNNNNKHFYIRWAPCEKCRPGLISNSCEISISALDINFSSWVNSGRSNELKCYIVKQIYSVHEKL